MSRYQKISIVTPTYNCAAFIRDCIQSVLNQGYKNFEHIVVDGASNDDTVAILKEYPHIKWISEPDKGEVEALNKGLRMVTGDIIGWLNADDCYVDGTLQRVVEEVKPEKDRHLIYGKTMFINDQKEPTHWVTPAVTITMVTLAKWFTLNLFQPSMFFSRELFQNVGFFSEKLCYGVDYHYWFRIAKKGYSFNFVDQVFAKSMIYRAGGKTETPYAVHAKEWWGICMELLPNLTAAERIQFFKEFYTFRIAHADEYYKGENLELPKNPECLTGFLRAYREQRGIDPTRFLEILTAKSSAKAKDYLSLSADLIGMYGETLYQHGRKSEAMKAFEWALAWESDDPIRRLEFGALPQALNQA